MTRSLSILHQTSVPKRHAASEPFHTSLSVNSENGCLYLQLKQFWLNKLAPEKRQEVFQLQQRHKFSHDRTAHACHSKTDPVQCGKACQCQNDRLYYSDWYLAESRGGDISQPKTVAAMAAGVPAGAWFSCVSWISRTTRILLSILFMASVDSGCAEYHTGLSGTHDGSGVR